MDACKEQAIHRINTCPIAIPNEFDMNLSSRKAIYIPYPQAVPSAYVIDKKGTSPCKATCPAHVSIQGYIALINEGKNQEALELFRDDHPFPGICGRVCHHPCESACNRGRNSCLATDASQRRSAATHCASSPVFPRRVTTAPLLR